MKHWKLFIAGILSLIVVQVASADVTTTPNNQAAGDETTLYTSISASTTTIQLNPLYKYINGVRTKQCINTAKGFATISDTSRTEWISWSSISCSSSFVTTLGGVRRGLSPSSPSFTAGTGIAFDGGSSFRVVDYPIFYNNALYKDILNTLTGSGRITGTSTGQSIIGLPCITTTQRNSFKTTNNGDIICNSTTGTFQYYNGGNWINFGSGSTNNATEAAAGKVQLGKLSDQTGSTVTASDGAPTVVQTQYLTGSGGLSNKGKIPFLSNRTGFLSGSVLGSGKYDTTTFLRGDQTFAYPTLNTFFGDGSDGDVTLHADTTLTRDTYYHNLALNGFTLSMTGYQLYVSGTLSGTGVVAAPPGLPGGAGATARTGGSSGALAVPGRSFPAPIAGKQGGYGGAISNNGNAGVVGDNSTNSFYNYTAGTAGGKGANGATNNGAAGGGSGTVTFGGRIGNISVAQTFARIRAGAWTVLSCGGGAGSGGGGGASGTAAAAGGGGSGSNGGYFGIFARILSGSWSLTGVGGNGGNGGAGTDTGAGNGGGGGGGNGACGFVIYATSTWTGTVTLTGGTGGASGAGPGTAAGKGNDGHTGTGVFIQLR